jgi:hypothetical protein
LLWAGTPLLESGKKMLTPGGNTFFLFRNRQKIRLTTAFTYRDMITGSWNAGKTTIHRRLIDREITPSPPLLFQKELGRKGRKFEMKSTNIFRGALSFNVVGTSKIDRWNCCWLPRRRELTSHVNTRHFSLQHASILLRGSLIITLDVERALLMFTPYAVIG